MKTTIKFYNLLMIAAFMFASGFVAQAAAQNNGQRFALDRVLIVTEAGVINAGSPPNLGISISKIELLNPTKTIADAKDIFLIYLEKSGEEEVKKAIDILNKNPLIISAERDYYHSENNVTPKTPNDPRYGSQWHLRATNAINAPQAWGITTGSKNVVVGIMDSGLDYDHEDLRDNLWINPNPNQTIGSTTYVNDIHGWNFSENTATPPPSGTHGTHVAGIVGARGNNGTGVSGVCWNVSLAMLAIQASSSNAVRALEYANFHGIKIAQNSWGSYGSPNLALYEAIRNYNGLFVISAGNSAGNLDAVDNSGMHYPAGYWLDLHGFGPGLTNMITVTSSTSSDGGAGNYGATRVHIAAPGNSILSTHPMNASPPGYTTMSGTSMAAPVISGVVALMTAARADLTDLPDLSPQQIIKVLMETVRKLPAFTNRCIAGGIVDAHAAVVAALTYCTECDNDGCPECPEMPEIPSLPPGTCEICEELNCQDVHVAGLSLNRSTANIAVGTTVQLTETVLPSSATNKNVTWNSNNTDVATVSETGLVTAVSTGTAMITVTTEDGDFMRICMVTVLPPGQGVRYVKTGATDDGSSWENASGDIQAMIDAQQVDGGEVWIAACESPLAVNLTMRNNVQVFGGFFGNEIDVNERQKSDLDGNGIVEPWEFTNATILSGQNARTVLSQTADFAVETVWDGITFTKGLSDNNGAGVSIRTNGKLQNCIITDNHIFNTAATSERYGAGVLVNGGTLQNCKISNNTTTVNGTGAARGGGIYASGNARIISCLITGNKAISGGGVSGDAEGGGIAVTSTNSLNSHFINCVIENNEAIISSGSGQARGGATRQGRFINCTFVGNKATHNAGGPYSGSASNLNIVNSIIWGNEAPGANPQVLGATMTYSGVQGVLFTGTGNINLAADNDDPEGPNFVDPENGNYRLKAGSPCINTGNTGISNPGLPSTDFDGNDRVYDDAVDMGAFEWNNEVTITYYVVTVNGGTGSGSFEEGEIVNIQAIPPSGEQFVDWTADGVTLEYPNHASTSFAMPANDVTLTANFEPIPPNYHEITVTHTGNGTANANVQSAPQGQTITLTAEPQTGNSFVRWKIISGNITLSSTTTAIATFTMTDEPVAIHAVFEHICVWEWIETTTATCITAGVETKTCTICAEVDGTREIAALGHSLGAWTVTTPATCLIAGEETRFCTRQSCTETETQEIEALGHTSGSAATCTTPQICTVCDEILAEALGHSWGEWIVTIPPTETEEGEETRTCAICGETETQAIPPMTSNGWLILTEQIQVYPNPFSDILNIKDAEGYTLQVMTQTGIVVHTQKITNPLETLKLQHLSTGVYILHLKKDEQQKTIRIVKL
ncbi:MAG: S8 family serine peptidase [Bacteroidales bacterium]|jgi:subtilisin family serine protease|nr:S8 family serine peptidase [Bacteroidales bacterium]